MEIMKTNQKKYAFVALIIAGIAALTSVLLGLILKSFSLPVQISLAVTVLGLAAYALLDPDAVRTFFKGRQAKHGTNSLILTIAVLGILVVVNLIGYHNTVRWDLTEDKSNTLADETLLTLKSLDEDVHAQAFFSANLSNVTAETLLKNYKANSSGKFDYEFIDPNENPVAATNAGITRDGTIVLKQGDATENITSITEETLTSALIRLKSPDQKVIYALTGHGEASFSETGDDSYYYANDELTSKNYTVAELNLIATNNIPEDAVAIIIAGPKKPLSENEVQILQAFIDEGGSLLLMYEPSVVTQFGDLADPLNDYLAKEWGFAFENDMVIDLTANPSSMAVAASYGSHSITDNLETMVALFPTARSITTGQDTTKTTTNLASTSEQSWAEFDLESLQTNDVSFDEASDTGGPVILAGAFEDADTGSRIVAFGDSEFASNAYYQYYANADLFLNAVDWVAGQDQLINLTARTQTTRLMVAPSGYALNAIRLGTVILIPGAIIVAAILVFIKRRREI
jgi:ABC-type uncharacterized transport system involved in gliding motility auxiliary subunit